MHARGGIHPRDTDAGGAVEHRGRQGQERGQQQLRRARRLRRPHGPSHAGDPRQPECDAQPALRHQMGPERLYPAPEGARGAHRALQDRLRHRAELAALHSHGGRRARRGGAGRGIREGRSRDAPDPGKDAGLPEAAHRNPVPADGAGHVHAGRKRRRHLPAHPGRDAEQARAGAAAALRADGAAVRGRHAHGPGRPGRAGHRPAGRGPPAEPDEAALLRLWILGVAGDRRFLLEHPGHAVDGQAEAKEGRGRGAGGSGPGGRGLATLGHGRGAGHRGRPGVPAGRRGVGRKGSARGAAARGRRAGRQGRRRHDRRTLGPHPDGAPEGAGRGISDAARSAAGATRRIQA